MISYLYVIGADTGPLKIGYSRNPADRIKGLQSRGKPKLRVIDSVVVPADDAIDAERRAHTLLAESRVEGEWFEVTAEEAGRAIRAGVADPLRLNYRYSLTVTLPAALYDRLSEYVNARPGRTKQEVMVQGMRALLGIVKL